MNNIRINAKNDFLESIASAAPMKALAELVWNGLDAGSDRIEIAFESNPLEGLERISVRDYGAGIQHEELPMLFGSLGNSWKKTKNKLYGRSLHGKNGQGRFKAFSLGHRVVWNTVFPKDGSSYRYQIIGHYEQLESWQSTEPEEVAGEVKGTEVIITGITKSLGELTADSAHEDLAKLFAAYLSQYPPTFPAVS